MSGKASTAKNVDSQRNAMTYRIGEMYSLVIYLTAKAHSTVCNRCMHILPMGMPYRQELKTAPGYHIIIIGMCCMTDEEAEEMRKELAAAEKTRAKKEKPADPEGPQLKFYGME